MHTVRGISSVKDRPMSLWDNLTISPESPLLIPEQTFTEC